MCLQIPGCDNAYLKFQLVAGEDWQLLDGLEEGITQASRVSEGQWLLCDHVSVYHTVEGYVVLSLMKEMHVQRLNRECNVLPRCC
jgi:hypothetical protein